MSSPTEQAIEAFRAVGWPQRTDIDGELIVAALERNGMPHEDAVLAVNAAMAQLVAEHFRSSAYIDVDQCTAHLLVLRQRDQVRYLSIDYVLQTMAAVVGPIFPAPNDKNIH